MSPDIITLGYRDIPRRKHLLLVSLLELKPHALSVLKDLELRPCAKPRVAEGANDLVRLFRLLVADRYGELTATRRSGLCHKLHIARLLEHDEVVQGRVNGVRCDQQAVVLQNDSLRKLPVISPCSEFSNTELTKETGPHLLVPQRPRDMHALLLREHDAVELAVHCMVLIERTRVLRQHVQLAPERRERAPVDRVRVRGAEYVWARGVDRGVDHEGGGVEQAQGPGLGLDRAGVVDEEEVLGLDEREVLPL